MIKLSDYKGEVLKYLGYGKTQPSQDQDQVINESIALVEDCVRPSYSYRIFKLRRDEEGLSLESGLRLRGESIKKHLQGANKVLVLALSLGHDLDRLIRYREQVDMAQALVLDFCGSVYIEQYANYICQKLAQDLEPGEKLSQRFSPGYGDLSLDLQKDLLSLVQAQETIGLNLSSHNILLPRKSITALVGLGDQHMNIIEYGCQDCSKSASCIYRSGDDKCDY